MKPFADEAHKTKRAKMHAMTGSPDNFESGADKAHRLCKQESIGLLPPEETAPPSK